jgi:hypothetical protein
MAAERADLEQHFLQLTVSQYLPTPPVPTEQEGDR